MYIHPKKATKKAIWLSYDFGLGSDFDGLYALLDSLGAIECGTNVAFFEFTPKIDLKKELQQKIVKNVRILKKDRIYIIYKEDGKVKGSFLFGKRKRAPWSGYATVSRPVKEEIA